MGRALVACLFAVGVGCGEVAVENGALQCSPDGACPEGYACAEDGHCWRPGSGPEMLGCGGYLGCIAACVNPDLLEACWADCRMRTTESGMGRMTQLGGCLNGGPGGSPPGACPSRNGGVCDSGAPSFDADACGACMVDAVEGGEACYGPFLECMID